MFTKAQAALDGTTRTLPPLYHNWLSDLLAELPMRVCVDLWGQEEIWAAGRQDQGEKCLRVTIREPEVLKRLLFRRDLLVIVEAYLADQLRFYGDTEQMVGFVEYLAERVEFRQGFAAWLEKNLLSPLRSTLDGGGAWPRFIRHSLERDRAAVQQHYDLSNEFYKLWLDRSMTYSCARFEEPDMTLEKAQEAKLDLICRKLRLKPGERMLDIGCGWGGLLKWAATHYGVQACGITLSNEQVHYNHDWIQRDAFQDRVQVELCDYREAYRLGEFDKIVSVGMIEHVGLRNYPTYFRSILKALSPGGLFLNHGITTSSEWNPAGMAERFIDRYIFPDGELSTLPATLAAAKDGGWETIDLDCWRPHYAKTLRCWAERLERARQQAADIVGEGVVRLWHLYLIGSAFGFERNKLSVYQTLLRRAQDERWNLPMTRAGWLS
ncbi:MAG TPA: class I SAM-dependent methyltransferase [Candidatus Obscuribacterales bacterium]